MLKLDLHDSAALTRAGIIPGISIEEYHRGAGISKSQLDQMAKSPAHYLSSLTTPRKETPAMRIGSLFHGLVLEPERVKIAVAPSCDKRTKEGKATWESFCAENAGAEIVTADEGEMLQGMVASVRAHPAASRLLSGPGIAEGSAWWVDEQSGELCRCRPDFYREDLGVIVDLKSTEDASPSEFARSIAKYNYNIQSAFYQDGVEAATGDFIKGFVFVAVEKKAPYAVAVYRLDMQGVEAGRVEYKRLLLDLADCKHAGKFPGYSERIETISMPAWSMKEFFNEYE
jgi:exodeoxyribonuclease VIII